MIYNAESALFKSFLSLDSGGVYKLFGAEHENTVVGSMTKCRRMRRGDVFTAEVHCEPGNRGDRRYLKGDLKLIEEEEEAVRG